MSKVLGRLWAQPKPIILREVDRETHDACAATLRAPRIANIIVLFKGSNYVLPVHPDSLGCVRVRQEEANEVVEGWRLLTSCREIKQDGTTNQAMRAKDVVPNESRRRKGHC